MKALLRRGILWRGLGFCALALTTAGCGDDKPSVPGAPDAATFIGTWQVTGGTFSCPSLGQTVPLTGESVVVTAGTDAPLQATVRGCLVRFDLTGLEATARAEQTCMPMLSGAAAALPATLVIKSGKFAAAAGTGLLTLNGNVTLGPLTSVCDAMVMVTKS